MNQVNILYCHPWAHDKCFGRAVNDCFRLTQYEWVCATDADTMFTTKTFDAQIRAAIAENPHAKLFTCYMNRNGYMKRSRSQIAPGTDIHTNDMFYHQTYGHELAKRHGSEIEELSIDYPMNGAMIMLHRSLWEQMQVPDTQPLLGYDNHIHRRAVELGHACYILKGVYLFHWYRNGNPVDFQHLKQ